MQTAYGLFPLKGQLIQRNIDLSIKYSLHQGRLFRRTFNRTVSISTIVNWYRVVFVSSITAEFVCDNWVACFVISLISHILYLISIYLS